MAKGNNAKIEVINKIKSAFGTDFIGEIDKKVYVWADDGGERVQIALSMTCPKTPIEIVDTTKLSYNTGRNFEESDIVVVPAPAAEISDAERDNVRELMARLGL